MEGRRKCAEESWRKRVAVFVGVLLPLPLLLLLWGLLKPEVPADGAPGVRVSPMLTHDQRMRLMTYGRHCGPGKEKCEPPLGCFLRFPLSPDHVHRQRVPDG